MFEHIKFPKFSVRYTDDHGDSNEWCSKCEHWLGHRECNVVRGDINPKGWCNKYERK